MLNIILDFIKYCCYREKQIKPESLLDHLESLAEHEMDQILKRLNYVKKEEI
jgi:hypothetical protein